MRPITISLAAGWFLIFAFMPFATVGAQTGSPTACPPYSPTIPTLSFDPAAPQSADAIHVSIVPEALVPGDVLTSTVSAVVVGSTINITLTGTYNGFGLSAVCGAVDVGPLPRGTYTVNYYQGVNTSPATLHSTTSLLVADSMQNYQGLWWAADGAEPGWGISFAHQSDTIFATWYTYSASGKGNWLTLIASKSTGDTYSGTVYGTAGPPFNADPFDPAKVTSAAVGTGTLTFADGNSGTLNVIIPCPYGCPTLTISKAITRQQFGPLPTCIFGAQPDLSLATNYTDMWWAAPAASESGWGIFLAHQGDTIFAAWFTYDLDGRSMWLVATATKWAPGRYAGTLYRTTGPANPYVPFDPTSVVAAQAGSMTLTFTDGNHADFAYTVNVSDGTVVTQSKKITREVFAAPGTVCQ